jgi:pimeloyl-ACP methyl ester carboxylesterase
MIAKRKHPISVCRGRTRACSRAPAGNVRRMTVALKYTESGAGLPVVLLHAFPLDSGMFAGLREAVGDQLRLITPDQRGFGGSPLAGDPAGLARPTLDIAADDLIRLLDALGLSEVVIGGVSMGGYVAMALLRRHPERVKGLILADTKAGADPEPAAENRLRIAAAVEAAHSSELLAEEVLPKLLGETSLRTRPELVDDLRKQVSHAPPAAVAWAQRAMAVRRDSIEVLRGATVPALVAVGEEDQLTAVAEAEAIAAAIPQSTLAVLPGAGHLAPLEDPAAFADAVLAFTSSLT